MNNGFRQELPEAGSLPEGRLHADGIVGQFFLLHARTDDDRIGGKAAFATGMFGMKVGGHQIQLLALGQLRGVPGDNGTVTWTQPGIDHQDRIVASYKADIWVALDNIDMFGNALWRCFRHVRVRDARRVCGQQQEGAQ